MSEVRLTQLDINSYKVETMDILETFALNVSFDPKFSQIVDKINDCIFETRKFDNVNGKDVDQWFAEQLEEEIHLYKRKKFMDIDFPKLSLNESYSYADTVDGNMQFNSVGYIVSRFQSILKKFPRGCLLGAFKKLILMIKLAENLIDDAKSIMRVRWKLIFPMYDFLIADDFIKRFHESEPLGWVGFLKNPTKLAKVKLNRRLQLNPRKIVFPQDPLEYISEGLEILTEADSMPLSC